MKKIKHILAILIIITLLPCTKTNAESNSNITNYEKYNCPLQGKIIILDKYVYSLSDYVKKNICNGNLNITTTDENQEIVEGHYEFKYFTKTSLTGYNDVTFTYYSFDTNEPMFTGMFTILIDRDPLISTYIDGISTGLNKKYYKLYINGKLQKECNINGLNPNTKYKVKIYKKATDTRKEYLLYSTTVKTKSK
jgi:hypothetical protein